MWFLTFLALYKLLLNFIKYQNYLLQEDSKKARVIREEEDKFLVASWYDLVSILISTQVISLGYLNQHFNGVIVTMLILIHSKVTPGQTKDYNIGICCFFANHASLRSNNKNWLVQNQNDVYEWSYMSICEQLFMCANIMKIHFSMLVSSSAHEKVT